MISTMVDTSLSSCSSIKKVVERLKHILANMSDLGLAEEEIDPDISILEEGLGLDSIMLVEFIGLIEEKFGFTFEESELNMDVFANLGALAGFIFHRISPKLRHDL